MDLALEAPPELTRLIVAVNRAVAPQHGDDLRRIAAERGLDSLAMIPQLSDFIRHGGLTREIASERGMYWDQRQLHGRLDELVASGHLADVDGKLGATERLLPVLAAMQAALVDVAAVLWSEHHDDVDVVATTARTIALAADENSHPVAVAHRALPEPQDRYLVLVHRVTTLRYVRQGDHAAAWRATGLTAAEISLMTALWRGQDPGDPAPALADLVEKGYATADPPALTPAGAEARQAIEDDTNRRSRTVFGTLTAAEATAFLAALQRLPGDG